MPIYEYKCEDCGEVFEVFQKVSDPSPNEHSCGGKKVHRIMSQTSFVLKGGGWYATDYAQKSKKPEGDSGTPKSDGTEKTSKTETKTEVKTNTSNTWPSKKF